MPETAELLTAAEIAKRLRISTTAVYALCAAGDLKCYWIGTGKKRRRVRFSEQQYAEYLENAEQGDRPVIPIKPPRRPGAAQLAGCVTLRKYGYRG